VAPLGFGAEVAAIAVALFAALYPIALLSVLSSRGVRDYYNSVRAE
jgi:hypothetical protein